MGQCGTAIMSCTCVWYPCEVHRMTLFTLDEYELSFGLAGLSFELEQPGPFGGGAAIGQAPVPGR